MDRDKQMPYEWLYWHLLDKGDQMAAAGVRELLRDRDFQIQEVREERKLRVSAAPSSQRSKKIPAEAGKDRPPPSRT